MKRLHRTLLALLTFGAALILQACSTEHETLTTTTVTEERTVQPGTTTETHVRRSY